MIKLRNKLLIKSLLLILSVNCHAQTDENIFLNFRCLALSHPIQEKLFLNQSGGKPIRIYANSRTNWIEYNGPNPITFYRETKGPEGQIIRIPVANFDASNASKDPLLLFAESGPHQYQINALEDSIAQSPAGSFRIFNFTDKVIAGIIANSRFITNPKHSTQIQIQQAGDFKVTVKLAENDEGTPKRLYSSTWTYSENYRYLVFIMPTDDRSRGNVEILLISDYISS